MQKTTNRIYKRRFKMKNAKFVIMLQVCFLIGIFVFSASAVYQPEQIAPLVFTNVAPNYGHEVGSPKHELRQIAFNIAHSVEEIKAKKTPDNAEILNEKLNLDEEHPLVYSVPFSISLEEPANPANLQFFIATDNKDFRLKGIEKAEKLSKEFDMFISESYSKDSIDKIIKAAKTSSSGTLTQDLDDLVEKLASDKDPQVQIDAIREIVQMGPDIVYDLKKDLFELIKDGTYSVQKAALFAIIARKEPLDASPVLDALIGLLESSDTRTNAAIAIANTTTATPRDQAEIISALDEKAKKANEELLKGIEDANSRILQEASLARTSSSGNVVTEEVIFELISQWQSPELIVREEAVKNLIAIEPEAIIMLDKIIDETPVANLTKKQQVRKQRAQQMKQLINNITQPEGMNIETPDQLFGSLAAQGIKINSKAINNINLEAAEQNFEELQAQLVSAKYDQVANDNEKARKNVDKLQRDANKAELELLALQRTRDALDVPEIARTSSSGIDQATQIKEQIEVAQVYMDNLTSKLEKAMVERDIASQEYAANDFIIADIEVEKLKESIALHQKYITDSVDVIAGILNEQNEIKVSLAGTIVIDDENPPSAHLQVFRNFLTNQSIPDIEGKLGYKISLMSELSVDSKKSIDNAKTAIISGIEPAEKFDNATYIVMKVPDVDTRYVSIVPLIQMAKVILDVKSNPEQPELRETLKDLMGALSPEQHQKDVDEMIEKVLKGEPISKMLTAPLIASFDGVPGKIPTKASSGGIAKHIQDTIIAPLNKLSGDDAVEKQMEAYRTAIKSLKGIAQSKDSSPEDRAIASKYAGKVEESLRAVETITQAAAGIKDVMLKEQKIVAKDADVAQYKRTVGYDDTNLPAEQQKLLKVLIGENGSAIEEFEQSLGCNVRLFSECSELDRNNMDNDNTMIISTAGGMLEAFDKARIFDINIAQLDHVNIKPVELIIVANGFLLLQDMPTESTLYTVIKNAISDICKGDIDKDALEAAIKRFADGKSRLVSIELPYPEKYDYDELEQLYRQALMALIAA